MNKLWLPEGKHWGLTISHEELENAGPFTGGGRKQCWHTAEGTSLSGVVATVKMKRAAPHVCIDIRNGHVIQNIPFNRAARALQHYYDPETNRANCWQVEICDYAANSGKWTRKQYRYLAALACLMEHRTGVPTQCFTSFTHPERFKPERFVSYAGHCGHIHVPGNNHTDPGTGFKIRLLFDLMDELERAHRT